MSVSRVEIYNVMELMKALLDGKWIAISGHGVVYRLNVDGQMRCIGSMDLKEAAKKPEDESLWLLTSHDIESFCENANQGTDPGWEVAHEPNTQLLPQAKSYVRRVEL